MKILIVASNMVHINNFHRDYIKALKEAGHLVYVMANGEGADFNIPFEKKTLSFKNLGLVSKIKSILKENHFDIAFLHTTLGAFYARLAMKGLKNRPYVVNTVHGYLFNKKPKSFKEWLYLRCEKLLKKQTDSIVIMNNEDYEIAKENKLCLGEIYKINGMGVKFPEVKPEKCSNEMLNLTFVGELSDRKNQSFLIKAISKLPNMTLTLVGDGDKRESLESYAKKLGVEKRVIFVGKQNDVYSYLAKTDIYVSASKIEGLPFNILEAMYMNLPILASNIKGHRDLLDDSSLFELENENEFISKIQSILTEKHQYETEKYSFDVVFPKNMEVYFNFFEK